VKRLLTISFFFVVFSAYANASGQMFEHRKCGLHEQFSDACGRQAALATACPGGATNINGMGAPPVTINAAGNYCLTANFGAIDSQVNLNVTYFGSGQITINCAGFTFTGGLLYLARSTSGLTIENCPNWTCNYASAGSATACLHISVTDGLWTGSPILRDLDITNLNVAAGTSSANAIQFAWQPAGQSGMITPIQIKRVKAKSGTNPTSNRIVSLYLIGGSMCGDHSFVGINITDSYFIIQANASAGNGIQVYECSNVTVDYSQFDGASAAGLTNPQRLIIADSQDHNSSQRADNVKITHSLFNTSDSRGVRCRGCTNMTVRDRSVEPNPAI